MQQLHILYPLFVMAALTFYITIRLAKVRVRAVLQDGLKAAYFKNNRGGEPPEYLLRSEQHYINHFEQPVLFYAICLIAYITASVDLLAIGLAWLFVATRFIHTYIHLGTNKLLKRKQIFIYNVIILITLWCEIFVRIILK
ncbi:MAG: MAPEG family protein [Gammaproteobacteria bacterium]|nr:MAPEG family protein [Gammaproteobacteria bacterium]